MHEAGLQPNRLASCALINRVLVSGNIELATEIQRLVGYVDKLVCQLVLAVWTGIYKSRDIPLTC